MTLVDIPERGVLLRSQTDMLIALRRVNRTKRWHRFLRHPQDAVLRRLGFSVKGRWQEYFFAYKKWPDNLRHRLGRIPPGFITGASIQAETAHMLYQIVARAECSSVVECGCGVSTLVVAAAASGREMTFVSLEDGPHWIEVTRRALAATGLENRAKLVLAPLVEVQFNGAKHLAHDICALGGVVADVLLIDAPVWNIGRMGTLPQLSDHVRVGGLVLLDDAAREGEEECVKAWVDTELVELIGYLPIGTGMAVLRRR